ncbi:MAG TPA: hypothetical protein VKP88_08005 [Candidatus Paceibacterota bacterium]|nr:hypothetical protein [Candidatus Paceibacterota bacterium]
MKYLVILLLLASCAPREITRVEKIQTRTIDTTVTVPRDIIYAVRPLVFQDTIVVENERVRTEVVIDTVLKTVEVTSEVKPFNHTVKATEVIETKSKQRTRSQIFPWWAWYIAGIISTVVAYIVIRIR